MQRLYRRCLFKIAINPFSYAVSLSFAVVSALQFFILQQFFTDVGSSDLHRFFSFVPYGCILVIPALGSFCSRPQSDLDLPFSSLEIMAAKTLACFTWMAFSLLLTVCVPAAVSFFGNVEWQSVLCGYLGLLLYAASAVSLAIYFYTLIDSPGFAFICVSIVLAAVNSIHLLSAVVTLPNFLASFVKTVSFAWHFDASGKGIIDTRDIIFYAVSSAAFLFASAWALERKRGLESKKVSLQKILFASACLLLLIDSSRIYSRIDTTARKKFSVSQFSKTLMEEIEEPLSITYYRSRELKNLYPQVKDVQEFLEAYADCSSYVSLSVIEPSGEEMASRLETYGIQGQQIRSTGKNTTSYSTVYSAVVISYLGRSETIPFVLSTNTLEYDLGGRMQALIRNTKRVVQVAVGNGMKLDSDYAYVKPWLESQGWTVVQTRFPGEYREQKLLPFTEYPDVPLIVFGSALSSQSDAQALVQRILRGGKTFIATSPYTVDIANDWSVITGDDPFAYQIQTLGLYFKDTLTSDISNTRLSLYSDQRADGSSASVQTQYVNYPLWPVLPSQTNAANGLAMFWPCSLEFDEEVASETGMKISRYLVTSESAWQSKTVDSRFITDPFAVSMHPEAGEESGQSVVACAISDGDGTLNSVIVGDQYAFVAGMMAYSSAPNTLDTRAMEFLSDTLLKITGETALLELKKNTSSDTALSKVTLDELYEKRIPVIALTLMIQLLLVSGAFAAVAILRRKNLEA